MAKKQAKGRKKTRLSEKELKKIAGGGMNQCGPANPNDSVGMLKKRVGIIF